jgi:hypothetical protein
VGSGAVYLIEILAFVVPLLSAAGAVAVLVGLPGEERTLTWRRLLIAACLLGVGVTSFAIAFEAIKRA